MIVEKFDQSIQMVWRLCWCIILLIRFLKQGKCTLYVQTHKDNLYINDVEDCIYIAYSLQAVNVYTCTTLKNNDETGLHLNLPCCIAD